MADGTREEDLTWARRGGGGSGGCGCGFGSNLLTRFLLGLKLRQQRFSRLLDFIQGCR